MSIGFFFIWSGLVVALHNKRNLIELTWIFCENETEKVLEGHPLMPVLDTMEGKKQKVFRRC